MSGAGSYELVTNEAVRRLTALGGAMLSRPEADAFLCVFTRLITPRSSC